MQKSIHIIGLFIAILFFVINDARAQNNTFGAYTMEEFDFQGRAAKIVFPEKANEARNWIWRARFWGHEPQADQALLDKGYHVVYVDVAGLFGNPEAVTIWNNFYDFVREKYDLNPKTVLEGMSRGGLIIYNWAAQNTDKVSCIYADAPVCDIKSWPGGLYKGKGSRVDWESCLKAYDLDEKSVKRFRGIPIYTSRKVAKANIPVMHICGDADDVVPLEENTKKLEKQFKKTGGEMELIVKKGIGHHPHSLKDPKPIVDFIVKNSAD
ncbi:prolyl oligopeptidase family serine peptidase [Prolixibacteraceae bacterium Z1-6]|uniref:Prolyl oligopeptidase family serine peptidase n=1 Tax=Draconibacterium aestuarii TaxID=2998507 RepID=A0A9X3JA23_9BACT|nr:prolyl oligopeptidase family serine peptidase [Prolixibacteraceae bacterium Z1-6]